MNGKQRLALKNQLLETRNRIRGDVSAMAGAAQLGGHEFDALPAAHAALAWDDPTVDDSTFWLIESESHTLALIEEALERIETGSFGECLSCGKRITLARLRAIPYAETCTDCSAERRSP